MQKQSILKLIGVLVSIICFAYTASAENTWTVNPNQYVYSMTITGKIKIDGSFSMNENDKLAAFIDDECRGLASVKYQSSLNEYFVFLMVYSNEPQGDISFKVDVAQKDTVLNINERAAFKINDIIGSVSNPFTFTANSASFKADLLSFSIHGQRSSAIRGQKVWVNFDYGASLNNLVPHFTLSEGATAKVNGVRQTSGVNQHNFNSTIRYEVISKDESLSKTYSIYVETEKDTPDDILLSATSVTENNDSAFIGTLSIVGTKVPGNHLLSLVAGANDNGMFKLLDNKLYLTAAANYEQKPWLTVQVKADDGLGGRLVKNFQIEVLDENDLPQGVVLSRDTINENTTINALIAKFNVLDEDEGDTYSYTFICGDGENDAANKYFRIQNDSLILNTALNSINEDKLHIYVEVADGKNYSSLNEFVLVLVSKNMAPEITSEALNYAVEDQMYIYSIEANDMEGDPIEISFEGLPDWLQYNAALKLLTGVPYNKDVGLTNFKVIASDGRKHFIQTITVLVLNMNDAPEINAIPETQVFRAEMDNKLVLPEDCFIDPDMGDKLQYALTGANNSALPSWLSFDGDSCILMGKPASEDIGSYDLKLTAKDRSGEKEWLVFTLKVTTLTAAKNQSSDGNFSIYPNPVCDVLHVRCPNESLEYDLHLNDAQGKTIRKAQITGKKEIAMESLKPGIYFIELSNATSRYVKRIIKQ